MKNDEQSVLKKVDDADFSLDTAEKEFKLFTIFSLRLYFSNFLFPSRFFIYFSDFFVQFLHFSTLINSPR